MTLSIIEQFNRVCDDGGDIICPGCGNEIHQYYYRWLAADHIEHNRCPICDCEVGDGTDPWCEQCQDKDCKRASNRYDYGRVDYEYGILKEMEVA